MVPSIPRSLLLLPLLSYAILRASAAPAFEFALGPLDLESATFGADPANARRLYDYYAKEAEFYMEQPVSDWPAVLPEFPGLENGAHGHWGLKNDTDWTDGRWNAMDCGSVVASVFRGGGQTVTKAVCVRLDGGAGDGWNLCYDPVSGAVRCAWTGEFLSFPETRFGLMGGIGPKGNVAFEAGEAPAWYGRDGKELPLRYLGYYRFGKRVVFSSMIDGVSVKESPSSHTGGVRRGFAFEGETSALGRLRLLNTNGEVQRISEDEVKVWGTLAFRVTADIPGAKLVVENGALLVDVSACENLRRLDVVWTSRGEKVAIPPDDLSALTKGGPAQWPAWIATKGELGPQTGPYAIDTLTVPYTNPYGALFFLAGHDIFSNGDAAVCTMHGDVWRVRGIDGTLAKLEWKRYATGLHQPLGLVIVDDRVQVLGRDQITVLHDLNGDDEADYYECLTNGYATSPGGHDYIAGLERDGEGNLYFATTHIGVCKISPDGKTITRLADGLRNPNGLGVRQDGMVVTSAQEGDWTPTSILCEAREGRYFGHGGPRPGHGPTGYDAPLIYIPRGVDNSTGGQVVVEGERWGPLDGQWLNFSWGSCTHMLLLIDEVGGVGGGRQGMVAPLPGEFLAGPNRGRFHPHDGQLYVTGSNGWTTAALEDGCFQRVRYTGKPVHQPLAWQARQNGLWLRFTRPLDKAVAEDASNYFCQQWNYVYSRAYGSPEFSVRQPGTPGHDALGVRSAHLLGDGTILFLEIPDLEPANTVHLHARLRGADGADFKRDLFGTIHRLGEPFAEFPGYAPVAKRDPAAARPGGVEGIPLPKHPTEPIPGAREIVLKCVSGLTYDLKRLKMKSGEAIAFTLENADVVPHNFALVAPGTRDAVGDEAAKMVALPDGYARQYVPAQWDAVLHHTLIIDPGQRDTIYFTAPDRPGTYPFLCTFPGHWKIMNGEVVVR